MHFGIDQYKNFPSLTLANAIADAEAVGKLFEGQLGYEKHPKNNATRADMVRMLNWLSTVIKSHDSVVINYSGHGYLDEKADSGYWIPADASTAPTSWISNSSISEMLSAINSKQIVMISDSCYSGAFARERQVDLIGVDTKPADILEKRSVEL